MAVKVKEPEVQLATLESPSGRTLVMVTMDVDGAFTVKAYRDGRTIHDFSDNYEQPGTDGPPKNQTS